MVVENPSLDEEDNEQTLKRVRTMYQECDVS